MGVLSMAFGQSRRLAWEPSVEKVLFLFGGGEGKGNVPHGESRHTVTRNNHIKLYLENRFMLSTGGPVTGCFVSPCVSNHRAIRYP